MVPHAEHLKDGGGNFDNNFINSIPRQFPNGVGGKPPGIDVNFALALIFC
jgi:hypothetical protein